MEWEGVKKKSYAYNMFQAEWGSSSDQNVSYSATLWG